MKSEAGKRGSLRKLLAVVMAIVIVIFAAVFANSGHEVTAGAGAGANESIAEAGELAELLNYFYYNFSGESPADVPATAALAKEDLTKYRSATMEETTVLSANIDYQNADSNSGYSVDFSLKRKLTAYFTESSAYYISDYTMYSYQKTYSGTQETVEHRSYISGLLHVYFGEDGVLVRFDRFANTTDGEAVLPELQKVIGRWIDFRSSDAGVQAAAALLASVNNTNFETLALMGNYILRHEDDFKQSGGVYTLSEEEFSSFAEDVFSVDAGTATFGAFGGEFRVDLHDRKNARMYLDMSSSLNQSGGWKTMQTIFGEQRYYEPRISASAAESEEFLFKNINNTVIRLPSDLNAIPAEEVNKLLEEGGAS